MVIAHAMVVAHIPQRMV